ncbi:hypothetical protein [Caulobacter sp. RHG1]|uniref:hypothetical protein n=1 Tax=Caulobacter sp. (strain RHG1) TaxID=2545762 RepID=UPI001554ED83|nr:hypothetical protein [Caulobacter sp. RHG1]NQE63599.1 hypothetical protein [Caulobacter sp. RHG1]
MNHLMTKAAIAVVLVLAPAYASAYPSKLDTRLYAQKQPDDDLVVVDYETSGSAGEVFYHTEGGSIYELNVHPNGRGSIKFTITNTVTPGLIGQDVVIDSLDRMFPSSSPAAKTKWRVAFTANFIWVEARTSDSGNFDRSPVYSTVAFFGAPEKVYRGHLNNQIGNKVSYGKLSDLMDDVKNKYAKWISYPYDSPPGPFLYEERVRAAIFGPALVAD